jgi:hypothetical protein
MSVNQEFISDKVLNLRNNKIVFSQLFEQIKQPNRFDFTKVPITLGSVEVNIIPVGSTVPISSISFDSATVRPAKYGCAISVNKEAISSCSRLTDILINELSTAIAKDSDTRAKDVALTIGYETITTFSGGTLGQSSNTPLLGVISSSIGTISISTIDFYSGKVLLSSSLDSGTIVFSYSSLNNGQVVNGQGSLNINSILTLRGQMLSNSVHPTVCIVNHKDVPPILLSNSALFLPKQSYNNNTKLLNGEIGSIVDLKLLTSPLVPSGNIILIDVNRLGYNVVASGLKTDVISQPASDSYLFQSLISDEFVLADSLAVGLVVNGSSMSGDL